MKKIASLLMLAALVSIGLIDCAEQNKVVGPGGKRPIVVPKDKVYVKLNAKGKEIARYSAGQVMEEDPTIDCVVIDCPPTFPKNTVCWHCKARVPAPTTPPPAKPE